MIIKKTRWAVPNKVSQITESEAHVAWDAAAFSYLQDDNDSTFVKTIKPLLHIPNSFSGDRTMKTWYILASGFNLFDAPDIVTGIVVQMQVDRGGRITDETVQLRTVSTWTSFNGTIGVNKADAGLDMIKIYGGAIDLWDLDKVVTGYIGSTAQQIIRQAIVNPDFGIAIRFQSHPSWPHSVAPRIGSIKVRLIYDDGKDPIGEEQDSSGGTKGKGTPGKGVGGAGSDGSGEPNLGSSRFGGYQNTVGNNQGDPGQDPFGYQSSYGYSGSGAGNYNGSNGFNGSQGWVGYDSSTGYLSSAGFQGSKGGDFGGGGGPGQL